MYNPVKKTVEELAADRLAWQMMLRDGAPPPTFRKPPPPRVRHGKW